MSFLKNEWIIHPTFVQEPVHLSALMKMDLLMSLLSDCGRSEPLPRLWLGEPLASFRRNGEQGGGAFPRAQPG